MSQALSAAYLHLIFSTKERRPFLRDPITRVRLHEYLGGVSRQLDCHPVRIGGVEDHVHLLCRFSRTVSQADWVKELKRVSSTWLKQADPSLRGFAWQGATPRFQ
jgi:putative transposase